MTEPAGSPVFPRPRGALWTPNRDPEPEGRWEAFKKLIRASGDPGDGPIAFFGRPVMVAGRKAGEEKEPIDG
jgi:hypothetical protein